MDDSDISNTDGPLSMSTTLSLSEFSNVSSHDSLVETESDGGNQVGKRKRIKKKKDELLPPEEKLRKCERRIKSYLDAQEQENAFEEILKLAPLVKLVYGEQDWRYADACNKLAKGYLDVRGLGLQAVKHAELAKCLILSCNTPQGTTEKNLFIKCIVEVYLCLGRALCQMGGKYKDAENSLLKSWQVLKSINKQSSTIQIPTSSANDDDLKKQIKLALADVYIASKQADKAVSALNFAIKIISEKNSGKDEKLVPIYEKLVKAEKSRKKSEINYETVVEYRLKAHEISSDCHALNSTEVADTALFLGRAYADIDSIQAQKAAETYFNEAFSAYKSCLENNHPKTLKVEDELARVLMRTEREDEAVKALKKSIAVKAEVFGECSSQVANTNKLIGSVYLSQGDVLNAHKFLNKCLVIETELHGAQHWKTKATTNTISLVQQHPAFSKSKTAKLKERPNFSSTIKIKK
ncbi:tetratricopeptide repeat protein 23-like [Styela clava]